MFLVRAEMETLAAQIADYVASLHRLSPAEPGQLLAEADEALRLRPDDPEAHKLRATALVGLGRLDEALAAHELAPQGPNAAFWDELLEAGKAFRHMPPQFVRNLIPWSFPRATPSQAEIPPHAEAKPAEVGRAADSPREKTQRVTESVFSSALERIGRGEDARRLAEEEAVEQFAAATVDRMIAALDTATATVEAQLAELRRMRRAA
jgi:hypothetical protein